MFLSLIRRRMFIVLILSLVFSSNLSYSQIIKKVTVETLNNDQRAEYNPNDPETMGLNFIQLYKNNEEFKIRFVVEVQGDNLPDDILLVTNTDKGPEYISTLVRSMNSLSHDAEFLERTIEKLLYVLPRSSTDPYLVDKTEDPELLPELYKDMQMKRSSASNSGVVKYSTEFFQIKSNQTSNIIFKMYSQEGSLRPIPLYYEPNIHKRNIYTLNLVVSPDEVRSIKIASTNPYQLGDVVPNESEATSFRVLNRDNWKKLYESNKNYADEDDIFEGEVFKVKSEMTGEVGYLKVLSLDDPSILSKLNELIKNTNANVLWFMPINEASPARMSPDLKQSQIVEIGDRRYIVTPIAVDKNTGKELPHKGLYYQHETTAYAVSNYLGGDPAAIKLISELNRKGVTVMLEEHPDKVSSFSFEYTNLSEGASKIISQILRNAGYKVHEDDLGKPLNLLTTKLKHIYTGQTIYAYQFFTLRYAYNGRDLNPYSDDFVKKSDRVPSKDVDAMPADPSEIYVAGVGLEGNDWTTFAQLKVNKPHVELIELIARMDYYERLFSMSPNPKIAIRIDAVHFGLLRYDERSQFVRYLNHLRQIYPGVIIGGEVIEEGTKIAWLGMPLDFIQPPTLLHRDNDYFVAEFGRTNEGQRAWENTIEFLKYKNKVYFASLSSYDTCDPIARPPFNVYAMLERCEKPYSSPVDWFTKEAYVYFSPNAVLSVCAGEECAPNNDYKNFKGDQFGYFQLPYEEGNVSKERMDLVSTYPLVDYLKSYLQENKYGYKFKSLDPNVLDDGYLSSEVYTSDKGVVIIMRNNGQLSYPMHHNFGPDVSKEVNKRTMAYESLYVVFDAYAADYNEGERYKIYKPDDSMLFENYELTDKDQLKLRRDLKPYETIVLATLNKNELHKLKGEYLKAITAEYLGVNYQGTTMPEMIDGFVDIFSSKRDTESISKVKSLFLDQGLLEWMTDKEASEEIKQRLPGVQSFLANLEAGNVEVVLPHQTYNITEPNHSIHSRLYRSSVYLEIALETGNTLEVRRNSLIHASNFLLGIYDDPLSNPEQKKTWKDLNAKIEGQKKILWPDKFKSNEAVLRSALLQHLGNSFEYLDTKELVQEFYRSNNWKEASPDAILQTYYYAVEQSERSSFEQKEDYLQMSLLLEFYILDPERKMYLQAESFDMEVLRHFNFRMTEQVKTVDINSPMYRLVKEQTMKNETRVRAIRGR